MMSDDRANSTVDLASNLTVAWLSNPNTRANAEEATGFLANIHATLNSLSTGEPAAPAPSAPAAGSSVAAEPAVTVRKSLASRDRIISMIDGKPYTTLKRHIGSHGMTPAQYRERFGLKPDYPMVAPAYAEKRRALAQKIGLGRKTVRKRLAKQADGGKAAKPAAAPKRRGRPPKK
jgi:predicted transcriptional regulator